MPVSFTHRALAFRGTAFGLIPIHSTAGTAAMAGTWADVARTSTTTPASRTTSTPSIRSRARLTASGSGSSTNTCTR
jgi:hypothetical protein